jgi:hypothetical protein
MMHELPGSPGRRAGRTPVPSPLAAHAPSPLGGLRRPRGRALLGAVGRIVLIWIIVAGAIAPRAGSAQPPPPSASPGVAEADAPECARRETIAGDIAKLEAARAGGRRFEDLVIPLGEVEKKILELQPSTGQTCPKELSIAGLTDRFDPIRNEMAHERRRQEIDAKAWPERVKVAVLEKRVELGMTRDQVTAAWGEPRSVDVTPTTRQEQWTYSGPTYLYFANGMLVTIARVRRSQE